jgi:hypothetical protein
MARLQPTPCSILPVEQGGTAAHVVAAAVSTSMPWLAGVAE